MSKKKYANVAEKQKAWRIRSGKQKRKVPLELRRGEPLGSSEVELREKKEGETWEEYHKYISATTAVARKRQQSARGAGSKEQIVSAGGSARKERRFQGVDETVFSGDYYEMRKEHEEELEKSTKSRKIKKGGKKT